MELPAPDTNQRVEPAAQLPPQEPNTEFISRSVGNRCLVSALRNTRSPTDFKGPRKIPNYTADMDPAAWIESYDLAMDMLHASEEVCARYFTMMLEGPARTWFKNLPENSITSWVNLREKFIKNFQGTYRRATIIVDLEHCV